MTMTGLADFIDRVATLRIVKQRDDAAAMIEDDYERAVAAIEALQSIIREARALRRKLADSDDCR